VAPVPLGDPDKVDPQRLCCAWFEGDGNHPVRRDIASVVEDAARCLASQGMTVEKAMPTGLETAGAIYDDLRAADGMPDHIALVRESGAPISASLRDWISRTRPATVEEYRALGARRDGLRAMTLEFMERRQILLLPVASIPAFPSETQSMLVDGVEASTLDLVSSCKVISLLGLPAAVVPCGSSIEGLPVAVQVVGRPFHEHEVIAVAKTLESTFGAWRPGPEFNGRGVNDVLMG
jgi:amidase